MPFVPPSSFWPGTSLPDAWSTATTPSASLAGALALAAVTLAQDRLGLDPAALGLVAAGITALTLLWHLGTTRRPAARGPVPAATSPAHRPVSRVGQAQEEPPWPSGSRESR
ncbi:hypothetical protein LHJ74_26565 [Streptomyces sp. N2-109]|uniref:Uncharacterized protein n=1 Tax=Streptomyces gossypii TaxID=2883101 RepID=A0ABT2JZT4_9ACTN|nr:hypothetical protein [Streptomyces gossypii]MCT2593427.1 hypothetical protein [Streptomyces gossypii]